MCVRLQAHSLTLVRACVRACVRVCLRGRACGRVGVWDCAGVRGALGQPFLSFVIKNDTIVYPVTCPDSPPDRCLRLQPPPPPPRLLACLLACLSVCVLVCFVPLQGATPHAATCPLHAACPLHATSHAVGFHGCAG